MITEEKRAHRRFFFRDHDAITVWVRAASGLEVVVPPQKID